MHLEREDRRHRVCYTGIQDDVSQPYEEKERAVSLNYTDDRL